MPDTPAADGAADLTVELLPARHGDAILLGWGTPGERHRVLVDAGPATAYPALAERLAAVAARGPLELLVLTHVDADHVEGVIKLLSDAGVGVEVRELWFNGWRHLGSELGGPHGEILTDLVTARGVPWNTRFGHRAVCRDGAEPFPRRTLPGGLVLTVLGPGRSTLTALQDSWAEACRAAGLLPGSGNALALLRTRPRLVPAQSHLDYLDRPPAPDVRALARSRRTPDTSPTNASTIVLLVEYADTRVLLCGDATPASLLAGVRGLLAHRGLDSLSLDALAVPHHGSDRNITPELVRLLPARRYLFSSDGGYHGHPHAAAVATVLEYAPPGAELMFNYATAHTLLWDDDRLRRRGDHRFTVRYPATAGGGLVVEPAAAPRRF